MNTLHAVHVSSSSSLPPQPKASCVEYAEVDNLVCAHQGQTGVRCREEHETHTVWYALWYLVFFISAGFANVKSPRREQDQQQQQRRQKNHHQQQQQQPPE